MTPKRRIIPIFVPHLGCPNMCVFCNQRTISGTVRMISGETAKTEIDNALAVLPKEDAVEVAFYGGSFTAVEEALQTELLEAVQPYLTSGRVDAIRLSTRPDCIDERVLDRLKKYGVTTVELGVQSMCDDVLIQSGRGHTADDAVRASELIKSAGIELILQMMTGLPGDTFDKSVYTARCLEALKPAGVRIYPTVVIKGTELFDMYSEGRYTPQSVDDAVRLCVELCEIFERSDITVIRLGLNPSDELSGGQAVAGAYHPAFGELVLNRRFLKYADSIISSGSFGEEINIYVAKGKVSAMVGQKRSNLLYLKDKYGFKNIRVSECESLKNLEIKVEDSLH